MPCTFSASLDIPSLAPEDMINHRFFDLTLGLVTLNQAKSEKTPHGMCAVVYTGFFVAVENTKHASIKEMGSDISLPRARL